MIKKLRHIDLISIDTWCIYDWLWYALDTCPGGEVVFQGRQGVFVEGQIHPPLQSVEITIKTLDEVGNEIKVLTDARGQYK